MKAVRNVYLMEQFGDGRDLGTNWEICKGGTDEFQPRSFERQVFAARLSVRRP